MVVLLVELRSAYHDITIIESWVKVLCGKILILEVVLSFQKDIHQIMACNYIYKDVYIYLFTMHDINIFKHI